MMGLRSWGSLLGRGIQSGLVSTPSQAPPWNKLDLGLLTRRAAPGGQGSVYGVPALGSTVAT